jgi:hypothetical protein
MSATGNLNLIEKQKCRKEKHRKKGRKTSKMEMSKSKDVENKTSNGETVEKKKCRNRKIPQEKNKNCRKTIIENSKDEGEGER